MREREILGVPRAFSLRLALTLQLAGTVQPLAFRLTFQRVGTRERFAFSVFGRLCFRVFPDAIADFERFLSSALFLIGSCSS